MDSNSTTDTGKVTMQSVVIEDMTVTLFDAWLCNGFFWRLGFVSNIDDGSTDRAHFDWLQLMLGDNDERIWYIGRQRFGFYATYQLQSAKTWNTVNRLGRIQVEQRWASKIIVFVEEDQAGALFDRFATWLQTMGYEGFQQSERQPTAYHPRPLGRRRLAVSKWARAEYANGRSIDELLPEYERRHKRETGEDLTDPRESLRQAIQPGKPRKPRNAKK
jgi:hypothetical protein